MSEEVARPALNGPWPVLSVEERRVLGVLVEKAKTTPDAYPLTLNALVTGCNQKSNRDPILEMDDVDAEQAAAKCKSMGLMVKVVGGRTERWRHLLYDQWRLDKIELAIIGELLLRGPQTEGELRTRASRMEPIEDLETLRERLKPLVERNLVVYLTAEDRRGAVLTHGFHSKAELEKLIAHHASHPASISAAISSPSREREREPAATPAVRTPPAAPVPTVREERVVALEQTIAALRQEQTESKQQLAKLVGQIGEMRAQLDATREELNRLKQALGG